MPDLSTFHLNQPVELSDGRAATVQFLGSTHFAPGDWIGVVLADASGKNDGEVQGVRYFDCAPQCGMFVRPAAVTILGEEEEEEEPVPEPAQRQLSPSKQAGMRSMNGSARGGASGRPSSMVTPSTMGKRQSILGDRGADRRMSLNAASPTPTPGARGLGRLGSPSKSPTKQLGASVGPSARKSIVPPPARGGRTSMAPPKPVPPSAAKGARPSMAGPLNGQARGADQTLTSSTPRGPSSGLTLRPGTKEKMEKPNGERRVSASSGPKFPNKDSEAAATSPHREDQEEPKTATLSPTLIASSVSRTTSERPDLGRGRSPSSTLQRPQPHAAASRRELEDLKTKISLLERKRMEDREKLKALEKAEADRDRYEGIIQRLQSKYQPQQQEMTELRKRIKQEEDRVQTLDRQLAEHDSTVEMAALDREMAEETAESLKGELEALRQRFEDMELEVSVLREENEEFSKEISPEEKTSQGWLQLEKSNERLREALMRLRDVTQEQEAHLKDQIAELESDVQDFTKTKEGLSATREQLEQANSTAENLRQQLDTALGAEDMIEELTEKNMTLTDRIEQMGLTIEELESLKELNDELEINHTETEKQLQDEIDYNESLLADEARKSAIQDGTVQDLEYTVSRFRDLVTTMQSDLEDMRASQQITESEANDLQNRSRAMMDLNMRLQTSASKAQVKAIDLELGKMQAQESLEHLAIVKLLLPDTFKSEQDSVQALLRFRRLGFKANMMHGFVRERITGSTMPGNDEDLLSSTSILEKLTWVSSTCDRFINTIQTCDLDLFKRLGAASYELDPVERSFNAWIDALKRDDLKVEQCAAELQRSIALMDHLADTHIPHDADHYPDVVLVQALVMQSHLDNAATTLSQLKSRLENSIEDSQDNENEDDDHYLDLLPKLDALISSSRSAKVITSKAIRQISDLKLRSLTLDPSTSLHSITQAFDSTITFSNSIRKFTASAFTTLNDATTTANSSLITTALTSATPNLATLTQSLTHTTPLLTYFLNLTTGISSILELHPPPPPPWKLLAQNLHASASASKDRDTQLSQLQTSLSEKQTTLAIKDRMLDELLVKNEVLEKRASEEAGRRERVKALEEETTRWKTTEKENVAKLTRLRAALESLEKEKARWKNTNPAATTPIVTQTATDGGQAATSTPAAALKQIETLKAQIAALEAAVRYHRSVAHTSSLASYNDYLAEPLLPHTTTTTPHISRINRETKSLYKDLITMATSPEAQLVKLPELRKKEDRLKWRPVREGAQWHVMAQREGLEYWRQGVRRLAKDCSRRSTRHPAALPGRGAIKERVGEVRIVGVDQGGGDVEEGV